MIAVKVWLKLCWTGGGLMGLLVLLGSYFLLMAPPELRLVELIPDVVAGYTSPEPPPVPPLQAFADIWDTQINTKSPQTVSTEPEKKDWLQQLVSRHISIKQIINDDFAVVIIDNVEQLVEPRKSRNLNDPIKRWLFKLENKEIMIRKITPGEGIRLVCDKTESLLASSQGTGQKNTVAMPTNNSLQGFSPVASNRWQIDNRAQEDIAQHYDEYIQELSPETVGQGLKIRRVFENSKASQLGLRSNDIITHVNGMQIRSMAQLPDLIRQNQSQKQLVFEIMRDNQKIRMIFHVK